MRRKEWCLLLPTAPSHHCFSHIFSKLGKQQVRFLGSGLSTEMHKDDKTDKRGYDDHLMAKRLTVSHAEGHNGGSTLADSAA